MENKILTENEKYMRRCIQLARNAEQNAAPNPMVGAVIVHKGRIIGEGYHIRCGEPHAEVNAIASVKDKELLSDSTIYVSLEPCSHYGKTPPCADLIIKSGIPRVVVGVRDPFAKVSGEGIRRLCEAGINVTVGVLEKECIELNSKFMTFHTKKRPYITLKWAESADHKTDRIRIYNNGENAAKLSTPTTQALVHKRRAEHSAILIGQRTALLDDPQLDARNWSGRNPLRIVIDKDLKLPQNLKIMSNIQSTWILCSKNCENIPSDSENLSFVQLDFSQDIIPQLLNKMHEQNITSLLVEGGTDTHTRFIESGLWDEAFIETTKTNLGTGVDAPILSPDYMINEKAIDGHIIKHYRNKQHLTYL